MRILSSIKNEEVRTSVLTLLVLSLFLIAPGLTEDSEAQGAYTTKEQIYLKNITPILYEFSQVASEVSGSVLKLQSSPPEECAARFADYRGIVSALTGQLTSQTAPPRLESVQSLTTHAMDGYSQGLGLYYSACNEEDFGVKEDLVSRGGLYLNKSVANIGKAYDEIEALKSAGPPPVAMSEGEGQITEGEITEGTIPNEASAGSRQENAAVTSLPAQQPKSKDQVLAEISEKVQAEMEAQEAAEKNTQAELVKGPDVPLVDIREEKPAPPAKEEPAAKAEEIKTAAPEKTEAPEITAPQPTTVPPTEAPSIESVEAPAAEVTAPADNVKDDEEADQSEVKKESPKEESDKDKIASLNQKIMEQAGNGHGSEGAVESVPQDGESAPQAVNENTAEPGGIAEEPSQEVAVVPPGGTAEEVKEEGPVDEVKQWCEERYAVKTEQKECIEKRKAAKDKIDGLSNSYSSGTGEKEVLDKCMSDWKEGSTYNYEMVISCTQFFCTQRGLEGCKDLSK